MSRVISFLNLAYRFNLHMLRKPVSSARGNAKDRFLQNYADDKLVPLTERQRQRLSAFSRCLCCGLCDTVCENLPASRRHLFNGPSDLACNLSCSMPDFALAGPYLDGWRECGDCTMCEDICPAGVPLREMVAFVESLKTDAEGQAE